VKSLKPALVLVLAPADVAGPEDALLDDPVLLIADVAGMDVTSPEEDGDGDDDGAEADVFAVWFVEGQNVNV